MAIVTFLIAFIVVFAIGMFIRWLIKKARKGSPSGNITIKPQINIGQANTAPPAAGAFCSNCGAKMEAGASFCSRCGAKTG